MAISDQHKLVTLGHVHVACGWLRLHSADPLEHSVLHSLAPPVAVTIYITPHEFGIAMRGSMLHSVAMVMVTAAGQTSHHPHT